MTSEQQVEAALKSYEDVDSWKTIIFLYNAALKEVGTKLEILNDEFQHVHQYNPIEHIKTRIKTPESIVKKLRRYGHETSIENMVRYINDIAGVRLICSFTSDIYRLAEMIGNQSDLKVLSIKDYIKNPKESGYKSYHMLVSVPIFLSDSVVDTKVEIQIRTIAMDFWASLEHKIYYKFEGNAPDYISRELKECAKMVSELDDKMLSLNEAIQACMIRDDQRKESMEDVFDQRLYESGFITYMRTDSVNLSEFATIGSKDAIIKMMGERYVHPRHFETKTKGAQEAHEAIRPTYMENQSIEGTAQEKKLYDLIWKRTIASQMADAELEKTTVTISISSSSEVFTAIGEVIKFDGFLRVYRESYDDENEQEDESNLLPPLKKGQKLEHGPIVATERFTQRPPRYTEASLVRKLEELGIGRPSTYAPTISTIQNREYVEKGNKDGEERMFNVLTLKDQQVKDENHTEITGTEKAKLFPTDTGTVVNDFLTEYFPDILDYNFTASVEKEFDEIAEGEVKWTSILKTFYDQFHPSVENTLAIKTEHKVGERILGEEPETGKPVSVKIGRFGPMAQIGTAEDEEKPRFAQMKKGQSIETITLEEVLELFKLPRTLGEYEGKTVSVGIGRFGPYVLHNKVYVSLPKTMDPMEITLEEAEQLILEKRTKEAERHIKKFAEEPELEILNGRYGPYIAYKGNNYKIPKDIVPQDLSLHSCMELIRIQDEKGVTSAPKKKFAKKK